MVEITALKFKDNFYIHGNKSLLFDGQQPKDTFHNDWFLIKSEPKKVQKKIKMPDINHRYELRNPTDFPKLKTVYLPSDVEIEDGGYEKNYVDSFSEIKSLYEYKWDAQEDTLEDLEFFFNVIGEVSEIESPIPFSYEVYKSRYTHEGTRKLTNRDVTRNLFTEIAIPSILHHTKPCKLTSKQSYDIVRHHIKSNINLNVAEITSDYDFCFTVKKKIELYEPEKYEVDVNNSFFGRKRKPKLETRYRKSRNVQVFEMTHEEENYKGYTPIKGFRGETEPDLQKNIDGYLSKIMKEINEPLRDCTHCKGMGVIT